MFDFIGPGIEVKDISLGVPVEINIENAVASLAACHLTGQFDAGCAASAMASFLGAERRFQFWVKQPGADGKVIIDDYAHHPDELRQSILSVKALYPERPLTVAFRICIHVQGTLPVNSEKRFHWPMTSYLSTYIRHVKSRYLVSRLL